ncbi:MAG: ATP-binding cassette domain-containing protein [Janthinobacterium lividum]
MSAGATEVRGLRKSYGDKVVRDGIDLTVAAGTVIALPGPNGAGKTTTVHVLSTLVRPDAGTATVAGCDVVRDADGVRAAIGLTGQFSAVEKLLTGEENLMLMARLRHLGPRRSRATVAELLLLPFLGGGFVPTRSMPLGLRWFAEHQPFTPLIEAVRGLLLGVPSGWVLALAVGWCVVITVAGYVWAMAVDERRSVR